MQGFNKYYPPNWEPEAGSLNKFHGKHALGDRARKLDQGILIVRFELPFNIWCNGCGNHIGMGVRYNAEKKKVGMYYTTPILSFRCKCHLCSNWFEIRTDPQNTRYVVTDGARQKHEDVEDPERDGQIVVEEKTDEPVDPLQALERSVGQKTKALSAAAHLDALESLSSARWSDPYAASVALRSSFRKEKKVRVESEARADKVRDRYALGDRVSKDDLRTPRAPEVKVLEDLEWERAKRERSLREVAARGQRKREIAQLGWRDDDGDAGDDDQRKQSTSRRERVSDRSVPSSSRSRAPTVSRTGTAVAAPSRPASSSAAATVATPAAAATNAPAVKALASRLRLNSALKADPFDTKKSLAPSSGKRRDRLSLVGLEGAVRPKRGKVEGNG